MVRWRILDRDKRTNNDSTAPEREAMETERGKKTLYINFVFFFWRPHDCEILVYKLDNIRCLSLNLRSDKILSFSRSHSLEIMVLSFLPRDDDDGLKSLLGGLQKPAIVLLHHTPVTYNIMCTAVLCVRCEFTSRFFYTSKMAEQGARTFVNEKKREKKIFCARYLSTNISHSGIASHSVLLFLQSEAWQQRLASCAWLDLTPLFFTLLLSREREKRRGGKNCVRVVRSFFFELVVYAYINFRIILKYLEVSKKREKNEKKN